MKVAQSRPTLCNPMDYTVHGILQDRILEWVAFPFSRGSSQPSVTTYSLGLCDMNCYSMNGSHASQGGIPMKRMSQIRALFTYPGATSHHGAPKSALHSANPSSCAGQPASLHPERRVTGLRSLPTWEGGGSCEHEGAVPAFGRWTVCQ